MARKPKKAGFEEQLKELEVIASSLEAGDLPLEESLDLFERGIRLSRELQATLGAAGLRVTKLLESGEEVPMGGEREPEPPEGDA